MILRLDGAGNDTKQILCGIGHSHHAMRFQFAHVQNDVAIVQVCRIAEGLCLHRLGIHGFLFGKIMVQSRTVRFGGMHLCRRIDTVYKDSVIKPAGAITDHNACSALHEKLRQRTQNGRMRSHRRFGCMERHQVCFDADFHAFCYPIKAADRL